MGPNEQWIGAFVQDVGGDAPASGGWALGLREMREDLRRDRSPKQGLSGNGFLRRSLPVGLWRTDPSRVSLREAWHCQRLPQRRVKRALTSDREVPLTDAELLRLEARNDVAGLPSTDVRRLIAEVRRLRDLAEASRVMARFAASLGSPKTCPACGVSPLAWQVYTTSDQDRGEAGIEYAHAAGKRCRVPM